MLPGLKSAIWKGITCHEGIRVFNPKAIHAQPSNQRLVRKSV